MLSERRNYGRIRINPFGQLGSLSVHFPVDELAKTTTQVRYASGEPATISCTGTGVKVLNVSSFEWSKNSVGGNLNVSFGGDKPHENRQPYQVVYIFRRSS